MDEKEPRFYNYKITGYVLVHRSSEIQCLWKMRSYLMKGLGSYAYTFFTLLNLMAINWV